MTHEVAVNWVFTNKKHPDTQIQTNPKRRRHARLISHALPSMQALSERMRCWDTEEFTAGWCRGTQLKKQNKNVGLVAQRTDQPTDQRRACQFTRQHERQHTSGRHSDCAAVSLLVTWIEFVFEISQNRNQARFTLRTIHAGSMGSAIFLQT